MREYQISPTNLNEPTNQGVVGIKIYGVLQEYEISPTKSQRGLVGNIWLRMRECIGPVMAWDENMVCYNSTRYCPPNL